METRGSKKVLDENQDEGIRAKIGQAPILPCYTSDTPYLSRRCLRIQRLRDMTSVSWWLFRTKKWSAGIRSKIGQALNWIAPLVYVIAVLVPHLLLLPFWDHYLFKGFPSLADGKIPLTTVIRQAVFACVSLFLAFLFYILDNRLKNTDPEADLITFCLQYVTQLPPGLRIIYGFGAYFILGVGYVILYSLFFLCGIYIFVFSLWLFGWLRMLLILSYSTFKGMSSHILEVLESMTVRSDM